MYMYMCMCILYTYIYREREKEIIRLIPRLICDYILLQFIVYDCML